MTREEIKKAAEVFPWMHMDFAIQIHDATLEEAAKALPTTWLDPLMKIDIPQYEGEQLVDGISKRIRALKIGKEPS